MSSDIKRIDTEKLDEISRQFNRLSGSLDSVSTSIGAILSTARSVVPEQPDFIRNINTLKNRVNSAGDYAHELSNAVSNASAQWAEAERQLANKPLGPGEDPNSTGDSTGGSAGSSGKSAWDYILEGLFKTIGGTGAVGKIISAIWSGASKGGLADWLKSVADIGGAVTGIVKEGMKGTSADWAKALFGLGEYTKTFGENMSNPVSWVVNIVKSGIDNWGLVQDGNIIRYVTETGSEAAVNVLLGAGGLALAAAVLPAGAPVIAVGAVGALAVWGVNAIVKAATGKDIAGNVGEIVGDATDWLVDNGGKAINWVAEKGGDAVDWVADKGKQLLDTGASLISDAKDTACSFFSAVFA